MPWGEQHQTLDGRVARGRALASAVRTYVARPTTNNRQALERALEAFDEEDGRGS